MSQKHVAERRVWDLGVAERWVWDLGVAERWVWDLGVALRMQYVMPERAKYGTRMGRV